MKNCECYNTVLSDITKGKLLTECQAYGKCTLGDEPVDMPEEKLTDEEIEQLEDYPG